TITIRTGLTQLDSKTMRMLSPSIDIASGLYVSLEVTDDVCGMTPEIRAKIFDPFFTTKFTGRGLGLAAVLGIARSHRGAITVQSEVGRGSTFKLYLPPVEASPASRAQETAVESTATWRGHGTILL